MIKCSICSYQCDNWYVSNWRLACHNYVCLGRMYAGLAHDSSRVALAWHKARSSTPLMGDRQALQFHGVLLWHGLVRGNYWWHAARCLWCCPLLLRLVQWPGTPWCWAFPSSGRVHLSQMCKEVQAYVILTLKLEKGACALGCGGALTGKLTWLVLGGDPAVCSHRVEQFTALWGL